MLFGVQEAIELLSECVTLEPGDVIAMGLPRAWARRASLRCG